MCALNFIHIEGGATQRGRWEGKCTPGTETLFLFTLVRDSKFFQWQDPLSFIACVIQG
jgi:hypothetical protein